MDITKAERVSGKQDTHLVSVIIPTIGRTSLQLCQEALQRQKRPIDELIVVEDKERRGASWARNEGIRKSHGDIIAFLDDDCIPPPEWIENLIEALDRHDADGVGGTYEESDPFLHVIRQRRKIPDSEQLDRTGLVGTGGNVMYKRQWLEACLREDGFVFDESFRFSQDIELGWRLRARGAKLVFVPTKVRHLRRETPFSFLQLQFNRGMAIAGLHKARRHRDLEVPLQRSLLWNQNERNGWIQWFRVLWFKAIGPFDYGSFAGLNEFALFWIGEKVQGAGFLWGMVHFQKGSRTPIKTEIS